MGNPFRYFNSSPEVIRLVVMMYVRYPLSLRNVEDLLAERGIDISHEGVVTRTEFGRVKIGSLQLSFSSGSGRGGGSPRPERFISEDAECAAGGEMALDVESVVDDGVNGQEALS